MPIQHLVEHGEVVGSSLVRLYPASLYELEPGLPRQLPHSLPHCLALLLPPQREKRYLKTPAYLCHCTQRDVALIIGVGVIKLGPKTVSTTFVEGIMKSRSNWVKMTQNGCVYLWNEAHTVRDMSTAESTGIKCVSAGVRRRSKKSAGVTAGSYELIYSFYRIRMWLMSHAIADVLNILNNVIRLHPSLYYYYLLTSKPRHRCIWSQYGMLRTYTGCSTAA